mgnify:CR=1 FL=1
MPARPHRTVDRVIEILRDRVVEPARRDLGRAGSRPGCGEKLGSGADQRTARPRLSHRGASAGSTSGRGRSSSPRARTSWPRVSLDHEFVAELAKVLGCTVLVGVRVGDAIVFTDLVGEESPSLTFVARTHARRPLYTSAAGKTLLANVPDDEMYRLLDLAESAAGRRGPTIPRRAPRDPLPPTRLQPRSHARGRVRRGHARCWRLTAV